MDGGPAFRAGLRDGDKLLGLSYSKHDPDRQARFTIASEEGLSASSTFRRVDPNGVGDIRWTRQFRAVDWQHQLAGTEKRRYRHLSQQMSSALVSG